MKKIFTIAAAMLASVSLWAGVNIFTQKAQVINDGDWTITGPNNDPSSQSSVIFPDEVLEPGFPTGKQEAAGYVKMNGTGDLGAKLANTKCITIAGVSEGDEITIYWFVTNTTPSAFNLSYAHEAGKGTKLYASEDITPVSKTIYASKLPALTAEDVTKIKEAYTGTAGLAYISCNNSVYVYAIKIEQEAPATDPVTTFEIEGPTEAYVGQEVTLKAVNFDAKPTVLQWYNDAYDLISENTSYTFVPEAEGTYSFFVTAYNDNNALNEEAYATHQVVVTERPAATVCADLITATDGPTAAKYAEVALKEESFGGKIIFVDAKIPDKATEPDFEGSFLYTDYGLQMCKGGKDSVRVILDNELVEGSLIQLKIYQSTVDDKTRGFNLQTLAKKTVLAAAWVPTEEDKERTMEYEVKAGDGLAGANAFIIARSNSAVLEEVIVSGCGSSATAIENTKAAPKAVKVIRNGQMFIQLNGALYNAQGAMVK